MKPEEVSQLRAVKRSAALLLVMVHLGRPVSEAELSTILDIDPKTTRAHLSSLEQLGFLVCLPKQRLFRLTSLGSQLVCKRGRKSLPLTATTASDPDHLPENIAAVAVENEQNEPAFNSRSHSKRRRPPKLSSLAQQNLEAFRAEGVGSNPRVQRVCQMEHVNPAFIHAQAQRLKSEKRFSARLLVYVVERADPLPKEDDPDDTRRYITGKYAEFIIH